MRFQREERKEERVLTVMTKLMLSLLNMFTSNVVVRESEKADNTPFQVAEQDTSRTRVSVIGDRLRHHVRKKSGSLTSVGLERNAR